MGILEKFISDSLDNIDKVANNISDGMNKVIIKILRLFGPVPVDIEDLEDDMKKYNMKLSDFSIIKKFSDDLEPEDMDRLERYAEKYNLTLDDLITKEKEEDDYKIEEYDYDTGNPLEDARVYATAMTNGRLPEYSTEYQNHYANYLISTGEYEWDDS